MSAIQNPDHDFCTVNAGCDQSLLVFSHRGAKSFALYEFLQAFRFNRVFVRDPESGWYNGAINGLGTHPDEVAAALALELAAFSGSWAGATGSSMGAYGAILYGCLLGIDSVLAFSPQTVLDPIYPLSPAPKLPCPLPDLVPIVARAPATTINVVCGEDDVVDLFYASRLAALPNVRVLTVPRADHLIVKWLYDRGELGGALEQWAAGRVAPIFQPAAVLDIPAVSRGLQIAVPAHHRGEHAAAVEALLPMVSAKPTWVGAKCMLGRALLKAGDASQAESVLRSATELDPILPEPPRYVARALMAQKKLEEALRFFERSVELLPGWAEAHYDIGDCRFMSGDISGARHAFLKAIELKPTWDMPRKRMAELGLATGGEPESPR